MLQDPVYFKDTAEELYQAHKQNNDNDYTYLYNISNLSVDSVAHLSFDHNHFLFQQSKSVLDKYPMVSTVLDTAKENKLSKAVPEDTDLLTVRLKDLFNLEHIVVNVLNQLPNNLISIHKDSNRQMSQKCSEKYLISKVKKYIVFLTPWTEGQVFLIGRQAYTNWQPGDCITYPWFMPHATANASGKDRYLLFVSGIEN